MGKAFGVGLFCGRPGSGARRECDPRVLRGSRLDRLGFAAGAISVSWVWFFAIGFGASALRAWLTPPVRLWTQRGSGALMLVFAAFLALQLI